MKDIIQNEHAKVLGWLTHLPDSDEKKDLRGIINEAFNAISVETDFLIARIEGDAGLIERAAGKLPNVGDMLRRQSQILKNYAARLKDSTAQISNVEEKRIITLPGINGS